MVEVRIGNFWYWLFLALLAAMTYLSYVLSRRMGPGFTRKFILTILWTNFALHFLKQLNPSYLADFPYSLKRSTPENLCALLIMVSPFIFLLGPNWAKDYMFFIGIVSGIGVYLNPTGALNMPLDNANNLLEALRFYLCHAPLVICSVLMVTSGFHHLDYHRIWTIAVTFIGFQTVLFLNEFFLKISGLIQMDWAAFFSRSVRNGGLTFGPYPSMDGSLGALYPVLIPPFLMFTGEDGALTFVPVLWMIGPVVLIGLPLCFLCYIPFEHRHMYLDYLTFKEKQKHRRLARAYAKTK